MATDLRISPFPRRVNTAFCPCGAVVPECAGQRGASFWIMSHDVQLSPAASNFTIVTLPSPASAAGSCRRLRAIIPPAGTAKRRGSAACSSVPPDVQPITHAPFIYQLHVTAAWMIWGLWPFSRLVHAWSYPLWYPWRPYIVYRSRPARSALRAGYRRAQVAQDRCPVLSPLGLPRVWVDQVEPLRRPERTRYEGSFW